jgi:hypothetical protein
MPAGDGTGPLGTGPMTGRGAGYCGGYDAPGWANWGPGRRFYGRGRRGGYGPFPAYGRAGAGGGGRGWRHWYHATGLPRWARWGTPAAWAADPVYGPPLREQEIETLKDQAEWLREQLEAINQWMDEFGEE